MYERNRRRFRGLCQSAAASDLEGLPVPAAPLEQVKAQPEKPVPLVFAMHGYTCAGEIYAGNSEWYKVADKHGFIVVHPSATPGQMLMSNQACDPDNVPLPAWNFMHNAPDGPDELEFFRAMLEKTCAAHAIDRSRVYATGRALFGYCFSNAGYEYPFPA